MNLPIGKLFYFVPKIQSYALGSNEHFAPIGANGGPTAAQAQAGYGANDKNLYDRFYEGTEPGLDPAGLFDYSKGMYSAITKSAVTVSWSNGVLTESSYAAGENRKVLLVLSGFTNAGAGKLIGPDGQEMDNEAFLSDLRVNALTGVGAPQRAFSGAGTSDLLFRVVTQKYGKGIVQYGTQTTTSFPTTGNGGSYDNIC
jgi:hypothetical protein